MDQSYLKFTDIQKIFIISWKFSTKNVPQPFFPLDFLHLYGLVSSKTFYAKKNYHKKASLWDFFLHFCTNLKDYNIQNSSKCKIETVHRWKVAAGLLLYIYFTPATQNLHKNLLWKIHLIPQRRWRRPLNNTIALIIKINLIIICYHNYFSPHIFCPPPLQKKNNKKFETKKIKIFTYSLSCWKSKWGFFIILSVVRLGDE